MVSIARLISAAAIACLFAAVYAYAYANPTLYNADMLMLENMYRDLFQQGGTLAAWTLPKASYWLDILLYLALRPFTGSIYAGKALYSAVQVSLLALSVWYAAAPLARESITRSLLGPVCAAAVLAAALGGAQLPFVIREVYHITTLIMVFICLGCVIRYRLGTAGAFTLGLFLVCATLAATSDMLFILWFSMPLCGCWILLHLAGRATRKEAITVIAVVASTAIAGKLLDVAFKPAVTAYSAVRPSLSRLVETLPELLAVIFRNFTEGPLNLALCAAGFAGLASLFFRGRTTRELLVFMGAAALCSLFGIAVNGILFATYVYAVFMLPLLAGPALLMGSIRPAPMAAVAALSLLALLGWQAAKEWDGMREEYYPPLVSCLDVVADKYGVTTGLGRYEESRVPSMLSKHGLHVAQTHVKYFLYCPDLDTYNSMRSSYQFVILKDPEEGSSPFEREMVEYVNGPAEAVEACPGTGRTVLLYPEKGAKPATVADYLTYPGPLVSSRPKRDAVLWEGVQEIGPEISVQKVSSLYRMNRLWMLVSFQAAPEELYGKSFRFYAGGDESKSVERFALKRLSPGLDQTFDPLLLALSWDETLTASPENVMPGKDGGSVLFFRAPTREMKEWNMFIIDYDGKPFRLL